MRRDLLNVNWTGAPLSGPQQFVIRQLAVLFLRTRGERDFINFTHELVEGRIYIKSRGSFGTFAGTFFHVDMGKVREERWTLDFLLPAGMENHDIPEGAIVTGTVYMADGSVCKVSVDPSKHKASEASLLR